jgi:hypothetical protein
MKFNTSQGGFSEKWGYNLDTPPQQADATNALAFGRLRLALCGKGATLMSIRLTQVKIGRPKPGWSVVLSGTGNILSSNIVADNTTYGGNGYAAGQNPDQLQTCIQMNFYAADGSRKPLYMAGIPDDVIVTNPNGPTTITDGQWQTNYNAWLKFVQNGQFGFLGKPNTGIYAPLQVVGWVPAPIPQPGLWAYVNGAPPASMAFGTSVQVLGVRMANKALQTPNGVHLSGGFGAAPGLAGVSFVYFPAITNVDPTQIKSLGYLQGISQLPVYKQIVSGFISREGSHKRGRFISEYRGRVSKPARL